MMSDRCPMLTAQSALAAVSDAIPLNDSRRHHHMVSFATGASGTVVVETAPTRDFTGTWTTILTATQPGGEFTTDGPGGFVRHRISVAVTGGVSPSVTSICNRIRAVDV